MTAPKTRYECYIIEGMFPYCNARCKTHCKNIALLYRSLYVYVVFDLQNIIRFNMQQFRRSAGDLYESTRTNDIAG